YLLADRSSDMQFDFFQQQPGNKWSDLVEALSGYLNPDPPWNVGLGVYPNSCQIRQPTSSCQMGMQNCSTSSYVAPNAPIGTGSSVLGTWMTIAPVGPNGPPALRLSLDGALQNIIPNWEKMTPNHFAVPVIIAGGAPPGDNSNCTANDTNSVAISARNIA